MRGDGGEGGLQRRGPTGRLGIHLGNIKSLGFIIKGSRGVTLSNLCFRRLIAAVMGNQ